MTRRTSPLYPESPKRRPRLPRLNIGPWIEQAEKAGKRVSSVTITLTFAEPPEESITTEIETSEQLRKQI